MERVSPSRRTLSTFESVATGRTQSLFQADMMLHCDELDRSIRGSRIAVIGAAGSIGSAVTRSLLTYQPGAIVLIDLSENNLVELVRDLRSSPAVRVPEDFAVLPLGLGSTECTRMFNESEPFDYIFNFSAIKHVRSEKDVYCIARMLDTNVLFVLDLLDSLDYGFRKFFCVSSDKATNPASMMGASKMIMEKALLNMQSHPFSTARFANVAFSDGSLPHGFLRRIEKGQPISAPRDVRRYFMSHKEAAEICLLSCILGEHGDVYFPKLQESTDEKTFSHIAVELLTALGYEPYECSSEEEAKQRAQELIDTGKWPCYFFDSNTSGEKPFEEFHVNGEALDMEHYKSVGVVKQRPSAPDERSVADFIQFARSAKIDELITKADYAREFKKVIPTFQHIETDRNLDQKM